MRKLSNTAFIGYFHITNQQTLIDFLTVCFQFQTFQERLSGINVDVTRRLHKIAATPEVGRGPKVKI